MANPAALTKCAFYSPWWLMKTNWKSSQASEGNRALRSHIFDWQTRIKSFLVQFQFENPVLNVLENVGCPLLETKWPFPNST
ncbi:hypothetical protein FPSE_10386 [Fusarium pseudograminearum CS3096]|uniref:Uncharacterized protein n=1 Tax=Fusarium pseudograminearum (strain CS3096) TaxID=1028729 RepID=K3UD07_FUSPC|nr:hypothetical protein FPSE_10386 [Fusarium pseudograminearum CS3096]EKJ69396.1 hypothetical protein FPSE_10386 [Fusarium pseudograminearum CS3096]